MRVKQLLSSKDKWCKGAVARTKDGIGLYYASDERACQFCLVGAIDKCYEEKYIGDLFVKVKVFIKENYGDYAWIHQFNDAVEFSEIRRVVEELNI